MKEEFNKMVNELSPLMASSGAVTRLLAQSERSQEMEMRIA
jgi:hypothetical protein